MFPSPYGVVSFNPKREILAKHIVILVPFPSPYGVVSFNQDEYNYWMTPVYT